MKKSIALAALLLALGTTVFAAEKTTAKSTDEVSFVPLKSDNGFGVNVNKQEAGKSIVIVYDNESNVVFKDLLSKDASAQKGYIVSELQEGDYTVEVASKGQSVKKQMHVYDDGQGKSYFFFQ
jgi:ABC-type sugar transport system substrate-binding protein